MKPIRTLIILSILAALITACSARVAETAPTIKRDLGISYAPSPQEAGNKAMDSYGQAAQTERIVIKNANLRIVVDTPLESMSAITSMASAYGGYVVNSRTYKTTTESGKEVPEAEITIRVNAANLDEVLEKIRALVKDPATDILSENVTGQDITLEYVDLQSRLATYEQTEKALLRLQENADKTEDVLNILTRLNDIRQQIESLKGQIKYYDESSKLSAVYVQLIARAGIDPLTIGGWQPLGVARDAVQALINIGKFLVNTLIVLVIVVLPLFLIFFFPVRWIYRKIRQRLPARDTNTYYSPVQPNRPTTPPGQPEG